MCCSPRDHKESDTTERLCRLQLQSNLFASLDETLLARAEALAAVDIAVSQGKSHPFKPDATYHTMNSVPCTSTSTVPLAHHHHHHHHHQALEPGPTCRTCCQTASSRGQRMQT